MRLYLVVIRDKELSGEPDIGIAIVEGNAGAAQQVMEAMERSCIAAGRARCVGRFRELQRSKHYRAKALVRTG